jgi:putative heme-binding domain-containing protein
MPAFHSLARSEVQAIVVYLRMLQGKNRTLKLPGDPDRGETVFSGKVGCSGCHMIAGKGGFIASDLSAYAGTHTVEEIRSAIASRTPGSNLQARLVTVTTRGGEKNSGRIRNEDNFSLQLQALDGTFFFVAKSDIENLQYSSQTLMPSDYGATLSPEDLNDIISYLVREAHVPLEAAPATGDFEDE